MSNANSLKNILSTLLLALALNFPCIAQSPLAHKHIAITQFVTHGALDTVRTALLEELEKKGYKEGENLTITFDNAHGNATTASQIARKFLGLKPDVIVAIATPSALSMVKTIKNSIPIVFSAVTDPVRAGLVSSLQNHPQNVTGVMDAPPIKEQMGFIKTLLPAAKTIGIIYNPGDNGSVSSLEVIREEAKAQGFALVEVTPVKSSDIQAALLQLVGQVDAIYVPLDNMIVSAMKTVSAISLKHKIPLFAADSGSVESGALACVGYSYHLAGLKTGDMAEEILKGKKSSEIDIASPDKIDVFINRNALETLKISLPESLRSQARFY
ncbi:MAG: ABC transporter substrate-binding protein [Alphaproteobacteria bacterium]|nr:ABC transporter substrate-binding protein [Alphaproteobacteria bacterium]